MTNGRYEKPEVLARIPLDRHAVIEASAGTGKTYALEHLILEILLDRTPPRTTLDQILVVTFTERATSELRLRVRETIRKLLRADPGSNPPGKPNAPSWVLDEEARRRLSEALQAFDSATLSTIHSFCQRVLTEHAFPNRRLFDQEIVDGRETFGRVFKVALREEFARDPELCRYLRTALLSGWPVERLESAHYQCHRETGDHQPKYDAARLEAALSRFPLEEATDPALATALKAAGLHHATAGAVCRRLMQLAPEIAAFRDHGDVAQFLAAFESHRKNIVRDAHDDLIECAVSSGPAQRVKEAVLELCATAVPFIAAVAHLFLPTLQERLGRRKREQGLFDFDDMLNLVWETLDDDDGDRGQELCGILRQRYRYALIDEFQDTDPVQWHIFERIFLREPRRNYLYVIGDPKQAIYGFRGADVSSYLLARAAIEKDDGKLIPLDRNFRSTETLIDAYNLILDQGGTPPFFKGQSITYREPVECGDPTLEALDENGEPAVPVHLWQFDGDAAAGDVMAALGARIAREIPALLHREPRPLQFAAQDRLQIEARDIFILTRTGREGRTIGDALRAAGIPHAYYKEERLFQRPEAREIRDLLCAIEDPHDRTKRLRAWLTPFFELTLADARWCKDVPGTDPLMQRLFEWHGFAKRHDVALLFDRILTESGLVRREIFFEPSERELTNYLHVFEVLLEEEAGRTGGTVGDLALTLQGLIDGTRKPLGRDGDVQRLESDRDAVQIMTMHKVKGLEAAVVFVAGGFVKLQGPPDNPPVVHAYHDGTQRIGYLGDGALPAVVAGAVAQEEEEADERLMYVAITRAKARLYLPYFTPKLNKDNSLSKKALPNPTAAYARVNDRLRVLVPKLDDAKLKPLFRLEMVGAASQTETDRGAAASVNDWQPEERLLEGQEPVERFAEERQRHRGFHVTSYTRMSAGHSPRQGPAREEEAEDVKGDEAAVDAAKAATADLPGGKRTGIYLHAMLEEIDFATLRAAASFDEWAQRPEVGALFSTQATRFGLEPRHVRRAQELVFTALTATVRLGEQRSLAGLASVAEYVREMDFIYPLAEKGLPGLARELDVLATIDAGGLTIDKGFVRGFVDFLFRHEGLAYFADWKGNLLRDYDGETIKDYVGLNYEYQERLYSLALLKLLRVHTESEYDARFGGVLYCFLRGMRSDTPDNAGIYFTRPEWKTVLEWERELVDYAERATAGRTERTR